MPWKFKKIYNNLEDDRMFSGNKFPQENSQSFTVHSWIHNDYVDFFLI